MAKLTPEQTRLIDRVCSTMSKGKRRPALLRYLCQHSNPDDPVALHETSIAEHVFEKDDPIDYLKDGTAAIRVEIGILRKKLAEYFANRPDEPTRIEIPMFQHAVRWVPNSVQGTYGRDFWRPFLADRSRETQVVYTEPLFFHRAGDRRDRDVFVRRLDFNQSSSSPPSEFEGDFQPCYNYVAAGEVRSMVLICQWLQEQQIRALPQVSRAIARATDTQKFNLVLLGSSRTNELVRELVPRSSDFQLTNYSIQLSNHRPDFFEEPEYEDLKSATDSRSEFKSAFVLVTRTPSKFPGQALLVISSHNARAYEPVAMTLTNERELKRLLERIGGDQHGERIDILFEVLVERDGTPVGSAKLLTWRPRTFESGGTPSD